MVSTLSCGLESIESNIKHQSSVHVITVHVRSKRAAPKFEMGFTRILHDAER